MLAISCSPPPTPMFSTNNNFVLLLEDPISQQLNNTPIETSSSSSSSSQKTLQHSDSSNKFDHQIINGGDHQHQPHQMAKNLNHNASERDRRRKINGLYSSIRSLLPSSVHTKKLSIPSTIARILTYIPELQSEVERLIQKKEEFTSRTISNKENSVDYTKKKRRNSSLVISASEVGDKEVVIQVSTLKKIKGLIAEAVSELEDQGLFLLNASSFQTFQDRAFYTLHFQVQATMVVDVDMLKDKLSSYFDNEDHLLQ